MTRQIISAHLQQVDKLDHLLYWSRLDHLPIQGGQGDERPPEGLFCTLGLGKHSKCLQE